MVCVGGATFGTSKEGIEVPCVNAGEETEFSINITAPNIPGRYVSYWRMMTPEPGNKRFGHRFWIDLTVKAHRTVPRTLPLPRARLWQSP